MPDGAVANATLFAGEPSVVAARMALAEQKHARRIAVASHHAVDEMLEAFGLGQALGVQQIAHEDHVHVRHAVHSGRLVSAARKVQHTGHAY